MSESFRALTKNELFAEKTDEQIPSPADEQIPSPAARWTSDWQIPQYTKNMRARNPSARWTSVWQIPQYTENIIEMIDYSL